MASLPKQSTGTSAQSSRKGSTASASEGGTASTFTKNGGSSGLSTKVGSLSQLPSIVTSLPQSNGHRDSSAWSNLISPKASRTKYRNPDINHTLERSTSPNGPFSESWQRSASGPDEGGSAGFWSCTANLLNTAVGTGCLALPVAVSSIGLVPGLLVICLSGLLSGLGLWYLAATATCAPRRAASFSSVSAVTFPSAGPFFDLAVSIKCFGVAISYLIIIGDLMPQIVLTFRDDLTTFQIQRMSHDFAFLRHDLWLDRRTWIGLSAILLVPLTFLKRLDSLKYTSLVALGAVAYLIFIVLLYFCLALTGTFNGGPSKDVHFFGGGAGVLSHLPIFIFSMTCHQNLYSICNEIRDNRPRSVTRVIILSIGTASILYMIIATAGYITFGSKVGSNIISMYPNHSAVVALGRVAIVILVLFSYPLQTHPCRSSLDMVLSSISNSSFLGRGQYSAIASSDNPDSEDGSSRSGARSDQAALVQETSRSKWILMTIGIVVGTYTLAMVVKQLDVVLSFVGSTGSTAISFILPGLLYVRMSRGTPWTWRRIIAALLALYGVLVMISCLSINIASLIEGPILTFSDLNEVLLSPSEGAPTSWSASPQTLMTAVKSSPLAQPTGKMPKLDLSRLGDEVMQEANKNETLGSGRIPGIVLHQVDAPSPAENLSSLD